MSAEVVAGLQTLYLPINLLHVSSRENEHDTANIKASEIYQFTNLKNKQEN